VPLPPGPGRDDAVRLEPVQLPGDVEFDRRLQQYWRDLGVAPPASWHARYLARLAEEQGHGRHAFWGLGPSGRVGFVVLRLDRDWVQPERSIGYIAEFNVFPELRRRGWGRRLYRAAEAWLLARGCREIELDVLPTNARAQAFWTALGFRLAYHHFRRLASP
jgi:ribosomal protein S18 acetylase RimI-like enzyme